jgi:hypothetical protein
MVEDGNELTGRLEVSVEDNAITVKLARTGYVVTYRKTSENPWLVVSDI